MKELQYCVYEKETEMEIKKKETMSEWKFVSELPVVQENISNFGYNICFLESWILLHHMRRRPYL